jgi:DNA mismatch repair protein MutS2
LGRAGARFSEGDAVQTPFGKGVVREVRNNRRLLVDVEGRALLVSDADVTALDATRRPGRSRPAQAPEESPKRRPGPSGPGPEIDLHGLTVEEALVRVESALNDALLADAEVLRIIHGRSGGRIRAALHRRLRELPGVRAFRLDPRNEGVTIVEL